MDIPDRIRQHAGYLRQLDPMTQSIPLNAGTWEGYLGEDEDFDFVLQSVGDEITRADVLQFAEHAHITGELVNLRRTFIATMLWGYGKVGRGPWRTREMLADANLPNVLRSTYRYLSKGGLNMAYRSFKVSYCGPAFFTKYFYYLGLACGLDPCPLILDSVVANSLLRLLGTVALRQYADVTREGDTVSAVNRYPEGYARFVIMLNDWARELGCRPDALELCLFAPPVGFWD